MRWSPFRWLVLAFRAAIRAEVEAYIRDRRAALTRDPSDDELVAIRETLKAQGFRVTPAIKASAEILPFPSVQPNHSEPPPSAA